MNRWIIPAVLAVAVAGVVVARHEGEGPFFPKAYKDVAVISRGAEIDVNAYLQDDGLTLFEFGGDW